MRRRLMNLTIGLWVFICVAIAAFWVRSTITSDIVHYERAGRSGTVWSNDGKLHYQITRSPDRSLLWYYRTVDRVLTIPYWLPLLFLGVVPLVWLLWLRRKWQRTVAGCCPNCGYDLRATPQRCPECGLARDIVVSTC